MHERRKPGPKPKGVRTPISARIPTDHYAHYKAHAEALGLDFTDYVALRLARAHGLPDPDYIKLDPSGQGELPISA